MLAYVIALQKIIDRTFFKLMKTIDYLFSDYLDVIVLFRVHIQNVHLLQVHTSRHDILYLHILVDYLNRVSFAREAFQ